VSQLTQPIDELSRRGIGVANNVAIAYDPADGARATLMVQGEEIATQVGLRLRSFDDTADALEWLSCPADQRQFEFRPSTS
jgi:hypothetical protein